jgi:(S)-sulfolactate dehydrogenase
VSDIVISEFMDEAVIRSVFADRDVLYDPALVDDRVRLHAALAEARALIVRNRTQVGPDLLAAAPRLTVVGRLGVGLDNIDLDACRARRITVHPAKGANDVAVAEYVITAALVLLRRSWHATPAVVSGGWPRTAMIGREIAGKTLGLIGYGGIGRETARRAGALGMQVLAFDPHLPTSNAAAWAGAASRPLDALLAESDVISLHVPLTAETRHLIDAAALRRMRPDAILINTSRGGVVDEGAVVVALREARLGGAALDVFEREPLDSESGARFRDVPNLVLTPHIAGVTEESNARVSEVTARAVLAHL